METGSPRSQLTGKVALVTGGSSGIGLAIAKDLAEQGAKVLITGRDAAKLADAAQVIGPLASWVSAAANRVAEIDAVFAKVRQDYGRLDIVVANAGGGVVAPLGSITEAQVDHMLDTNVKGAIFTVQGALPLMSAGGSIVLIGSTASINPPVGMSVYGATKAAARNLVRSWIQEIRGSGIRINVVSPGPVRTPGLEGNIPPDQAAAVFGVMTEKSTVGRLGTPEDIAQTVAFVVSDVAGYINGGELFVDGGASQI